MTADTDEWMFSHHDSPLVTFENKDRVTLGHTVGGVGIFTQVTLYAKIPRENMCALNNKCKKNWVL